MQLGLSAASLALAFSGLRTNCPLDSDQGFCDGHSRTLTLMSSRHFLTILAASLVSVSIWKAHVQPSFSFQADVLRCCLNISTVFPFLMMASILWRAPVPVAAYQPHYMMLPHEAFALSILHMWLLLHDSTLETWTVIGKTNSAPYNRLGCIRMYDWCNENW